MDDSQLAAKILAFVQAPGYQPVKPKVIAKKLGLEKDDAQRVRRAVKRMVKSGQLAWGGTHLVRLPGDSQSNHVTGVFRRTAKGTGFVRPRGSAPRDKSQDIMVPAKHSKDAASGDIVVVQLRKSASPGDRQTGEVIEILERDTHQFVGLYFEEHAQSFVRIDGGVFAEPVPVGDPGAKNAQPGDKVVIEMVRFPSHWHAGEGVITEVLGARGDPGVDTLSIMREFNLPGDFAEATLEDAREQAEAFERAVPDDDEAIALPPGRTDLTGETIITIDPKDARDFDDAISLTRIENGHWRLGVHIADVSHFVRPASALDVEARDRATSVYLPDRVIPMLPEIISNNLASLQPNRVRFTKTVFIEFTPDGARIATEPAAGAIKSCRRFTYEEVDEYLADRESYRAKLAPEVHDLLGRMHELAMILRKRRFERGSLELDMKEVEIDLNRDGGVSGAHLRENTESHQIIEEFMLAANEAVAELLDDRELFFLRRIHAPPDAKKLRDLKEFMREFGIECDNLEDRFEVQRVLNEVKGQPHARSVNFAVLRSMQKAVYGPEEEGHYALASRNYCHFTSPIRRYPDLTVHRLLDAIIAQRTPVSDFDALTLLGEHCSGREQRAEAAERELIKVKLLDYLAHRIGEKFEAVVTGVQDFGLFAQGVRIPAEGLIHVSSMVDDYYHYDAPTHTLSGSRQGNQYRLGDLIRVEVAHVDIEKRSLDFRLAGLIRHVPLPATSGSRGAKRPSGKGGGKPKGLPRRPKGQATTSATRRKGKKSGAGKQKKKSSKRGKRK
ncbi:MAG: ribonuclease R [Planctomycetales bacterium]|nr:ribonuclease R [Planctomycetales bacterium]